MKVTKEKAAANRRAIVDASVRAFKGGGIGGVGVDGIMKTAGFTHGGFYNHFESKDALVVEAMTAAFAPAADHVEKVAHDEEAFFRALDGYLTLDQRDDPASACPTSTLVNDAARQSPEARRAFAAGIARYVKAFEQRMPGAPAEAKDAAMNTLALMVGAMVLARGIGDANDDFSRKFLRAARRKITAERASSGRALAAPKPRTTRPGPRH